MCGIFPIIAFVYSIYIAPAVFAVIIGEKLFKVADNTLAYPLIAFLIWFGIIGAISALVS